MAELMTSFELEEFLESIDLVGIRFLSSLKGRFWLEQQADIEEDVDYDVVADLGD